MPTILRQSSVVTRVSSRRVHSHRVDPGDGRPDDRDFDHGAGARELLPRPHPGFGGAPAARVDARRARAGRCLKAYRWNCGWIQRTARLAWKLSPAMRRRTRKAVELTMDSDIQLQVHSSANNASCRCYPPPRKQLRLRQRRARSRAATPMCPRSVSCLTVRSARTSPKTLVLTGRDGISICLQQSRNRHEL